MASQSSILGPDLEAALPDSVIRAEQAVARNVDVLSPLEQANLGASRVLIAGCGSVGGAVIEPLVRLGIGGVVLADPEVYDLTNMNRQLCTLADVGRPKAVVASERALAINPHLWVRTYDDGVSEQNMDAALEGVTIAFDGVDAAMSAWEKYLLHATACKLRIPVLAGMDFGGKAVIYVFDYRQPGARPFYGKVTDEAHRSGRLVDCLKWIGYSHFPADFLPIIEDRIANRKPWPQVSYCVQAMGALGTRCVVELAMGRSLPHVVAFDTHMELRTPLQRWVEYARLPQRLIRTYRGVRKPATADQRTEPSTLSRDLEKVLDSAPSLRRVVEAIRLAPSPHNVQPWKLLIQPPREITVGWDRARSVPAVDPSGHAIAIGLGCGIEAAASIADFDFEPGTLEDINDPAYRAGVLHIRGLRADVYAWNMALLGKRCTNRYPFLKDPLPPRLADRCAELASTRGAEAVFARLEGAEIEKLTLDGALQLLERPDYQAELLQKMRLRRAEQTQSPTGFAREGLAIGWTTAQVLALLRDNDNVRSIANRFGLARVMAQQASKAVRQCAGFIVIATSDPTTRGRVDAGRAMMRVWLELTAQDIACQPVDFPISYAEGRARVADLFGLERGAQPIALLRVGRSHVRPQEPSLRLPVGEFCRVVDTGLSQRPFVAMLAEA